MAIVGFIGTGNMGGALARAAAKSGVADTLLLANRSPEKAQRLAQELGGAAVSNREAARRAQVLFLGVKPHLLQGMLEGDPAGVAGGAAHPAHHAQYPGLGGRRRHAVCRKRTGNG